MDRESSLSHYNMMNVLSTHALIGAYQPEGRAWVDELCQVLSSNVAFACDYIQQHFEGSMWPVRRAPICCLWTAPTGAAPTARPLRMWSGPAGR